MLAVLVRKNGIGSARCRLESLVVIAIEGSGTGNISRWYQDVPVRV